MGGTVSGARSPSRVRGGIAAGIAHRQAVYRRRRPHGPRVSVAHAAAWADWTSDFRGPRGAFAHSCGRPHRTARRPARRLMLRSPTSDRPAGGGAPKLLAGRRRPRPAAHAVAAACRRGRETGMGRPNEDGCDGEKDARMCTTTLSGAGVGWRPFRETSPNPWKVRGFPRARWGRVPRRRVRVATS